MKSELSRQNDYTMVLVDTRVLREATVTVKEEIAQQEQDAELAGTRYHRAIDFLAHWQPDTGVIPQSRGSVVLSPV